MVDITATVTGSNKITLSVLAGLYTVDRATGYSILLDSTQYLIPVPLPAVNPLDDGQYILQVNTPGSDPLVVGTYTLGYLPSPAPGDGAVTSVPITPPGGGPQRRHSFAVWFSSINGPSPAGTFAFCQLTGAGAFQMTLGATNDLQVTDYLWSANDPGPPYGTDATWHLFVLTRDNNTIRVYYDGAEIIFDPTAQLVDFDNPTPTLDVGQMSVFFNSIGTGAVWFRALSNQEVIDLYALTTFPP